MAGIEIIQKLKTCCIFDEINHDPRVPMKN